MFRYCVTWFFEATGFPCLRFFAASGTPPALIIVIMVIFLPALIIVMVIIYVCGAPLPSRTLTTQLAEQSSWSKALGINRRGALPSAEMLSVVVAKLCLARPSS